MTAWREYSLELLKADPDLRIALAGCRVRIWSEEHGAYWRDGGGYTTRVPEVGVFPFEEAYKRVHHAGPEKMVRLEVVL